MQQKNKMTTKKAYRIGVLVGKGYKYSQAYAIVMKKEKWEFHDYNQITDKPLD